MIDQINLIDGLNLNPIPLDFSQSLTTVEWLCAMQNKINAMVDAVNGITTDTNDYTDQQVALIMIQLNELEVHLKEFCEIMVGDEHAAMIVITNNLASQINSVSVTLTNLVNVKDQATRAYIDGQITEVRQEISDAIPFVYDPTTGVVTDLQTALNNIFNAFVTNAITAAEFDGLGITAEAFDAKGITAYEFDTNGKDLLL